jgi:hypothetical protein
MRSRARFVRRDISPVPEKIEVETFNKRFDGIDPAG